jgi:hypothetical protein
MVSCLDAYCLLFRLISLLFIVESLLYSNNIFNFFIFLYKKCRLIGVIVSRMPRVENLRPAMGRGIDSRNRVWN